MSTPRLVTQRPSGVVDTVYADGLKTRERDGVIVAIRGVGAVDTGSVYGYAARWIYERLSTEEISDILNSEYEAELHERMASGLSIFDAGIDLLIAIGVDPEVVAAREPVRSWPPVEFLEEE